MSLSSLLLVILLSLNIVQGGFGNYRANVSILRAHLKEIYDGAVAVPPSTTKVFLKFEVVRIFYVNKDTNEVSVMALMTMKWKDPELGWKTSGDGGFKSTLTETWLDKDVIWTPSVQSLKAGSRLDPIGEPILHVTSQGQCTLTQRCIVSTHAMESRENYQEKIIRFLFAVQPSSGHIELFDFMDSQGSIIRSEHYKHISEQWNVVATKFGSSGKYEVPCLVYDVKIVPKASSLVLRISRILATTVPLLMIFSFPLRTNSSSDRPRVFGALFLLAGLGLIEVFGGVRKENEKYLVLYEGLLAITGGEALLFYIILESTVNLGRAIPRFFQTLLCPFAFLTCGRRERSRDSSTANTSSLAHMQHSKSQRLIRQIPTVSSNLSTFVPMQNGYDNQSCHLQGGICDSRAEIRNCWQPVTAQPEHHFNDPMRSNGLVSPLRNVRSLDSCNFPVGGAETRFTCGGAEMPSRAPPRCNTVMENGGLRNPNITVNSDDSSHLESELRDIGGMLVSNDPSGEVANQQQQQQHPNGISHQQMRERHFSSESHRANRIAPHSLYALDGHGRILSGPLHPNGFHPHGHPAPHAGFVPNYHQIYHPMSHYPITPSRDTSSGSGVKIDVFRLTRKEAIVIVDKLFAFIAVIVAFCIGFLY